jgi:hypothetical protein
MSVRRAATLLVLLLLAGGSARAQQTVNATEALDFDRPESWAMKYYSSLTLLTGLGVPERLGAGRVELGFEGGLVPQLDDVQRRIGFNGTKLEDVNKTSFFGRIRARVGFSSSYSLELGYVPPFEVGGAKSHLLAIGIGRPFRLSERWDLGLRAYGQIGTLKADITCSADEVAAGADPDRNPYLCEEPSKDEMKPRLAGVELSGGYTAGAWRPHVGVAFNYLDPEFTVNARYSGVVDRTLQLTDGPSVSVSGGLSYTPSARWRLTGELFYSWLTIVRPPATTSQNEGFFNGRFFVSYRLR